MLDWKICPPLQKLETDCMHQARIVHHHPMNGIEVEAVMFGHNFNQQLRGQRPAPGTSPACAASRPVSRST